MKRKRLQVEGPKIQGEDRLSTYKTLTLITRWTDYVMKLSNILKAANLIGKVSGSCKVQILLNFHYQVGYDK